MGLQTAFAVAASFGFVLPTPTMVDAIYEQAEFHLRPQPLPARPRDAVERLLLGASTAHPRAAHKHSMRRSAR